MSLTTRSINSLGDTANIENGYLAGDFDPKNFSYKTAVTNEDLLSMLIRNGKIKKATVWYAGEAMRERIEFDEEQEMTQLKFGQTHTFKTFNEWLTWNDFWIEALKAMFWSLLFGEAILIFYDGKELDSGVYGETTKKFYAAEKEWKNDYLKCKAFYPLTSGNGYTPIKPNPNFGNPEAYQINLMMDKAESSEEYYVGAYRVVRFNAPQLSLKYSGTSTVSQVFKDSLVQEQIKRAIAAQMNMLQAGIMAIKAANADEKKTVSDAIGDSLSYLRRVFVKDIEEVDKILKMFVPEMKIDQFDKMNTILQKDIASGIDMSTSTLEGAPSGQQSSAAYDTLNTYSKIKQIQTHFTKPFEESFFKLGKKETTFTWNDPTPQLQTAGTGVSGPGPNDPDEAPMTPENKTNEKKENE